MADNGLYGEDAQDTQGGNNKVLIIVAVVLVVLCCCLAALAGAGWWLWNNGDALFGLTFQRFMYLL